MAEKEPVSTPDVPVLGETPHFPFSIHRIPSGCEAIQIGGRINTFSSGLFGVGEEYPFGTIIEYLRDMRQHLDIFDPVVIKKLEGEGLEGKFQRGIVLGTPNPERMGMGGEILLGLVREDLKPCVNQFGILPALDSEIRQFLLTGDFKYGYDFQPISPYKITALAARINLRPLIDRFFTPDGVSTLQLDQSPDNT